MRSLKRRFWINVSLPSGGAKARYRKAAKQVKKPLATWAREQLDRGADEVLGPAPFRDVA